MRVVVIGATGHVGGYLIPRLVQAGHEVIAVSRGLRSPYHEHPAWAEVTRITADREADDDAGTFGARIADLHAAVVIDMICFTPSSAQQLADALRRAGSLLIHCGSIWVHGPAVEVPVTEDAARRPSGSYGIGKAAIEELLWRESRSGLRAVILHPGHISGPGWPVINPAGNLDPGVWRQLARGERVTLPNFGLETVHHVHADDVAQAFQLALDPPEAAIGESFHVVSPRALTLRGFAEAAAGWFGREANLNCVPFEQFRQMTATEHADVTYEHISRSPSMSIAKAGDLLGYAPRYTSLQAVAEAVHWLHRNGRLALGPVAAHWPEAQPEAD
ncbi:NAD-dependent epimerase/dehydratase family protein [Arthrobacter sp. A5]|uniref:NAD-dependent epimerase/dehydratase family protein n=1 Tax=Arthrobacter sp. A5 TaxID=576926 RepID=UPI003DA8E838